MGRWEELEHSQDSQHTLARGLHLRPRQGSAGSQCCEGHTPPAHTGTRVQGSAQWRYDEGIPDELW